MIKLPTSLASQKVFTIRTCEIGQNKKATAAHLLKLMHEAAMQNVIELNLSVWDLEKEKISWVLRHIQFEVERLPDLGEEISILTYPAGFQRLFTFRDYRVFDQHGKQIAFAASKWLLMNMKTRRMAPIPDYIAQMEMPKSEDCLDRPAGKLPSWQEAIYQQNFQVTRAALDFNGHLNNVYYLNWMLEPLPANILKDQQLAQLDILYRAEAIWQEELVAEVHPLEEEASFLHRLWRAGDGKELAVARSRWV